MIEVCDLCKEKEPNHQFKIRMSKKGYHQRTSYGIGWVNLWQPYKRIYICEDCAEKLFGIKSNKTIVNEIVNAHKQTMNI